jgi:hypothetical protein
MAFTGDTTNASAVITSIGSTTSLLVGMIVTGSGIPDNASILSKTSTTITLSLAATATATGVTFTPHAIKEVIAELITENTVSDVETVLMQGLRAIAALKSTADLDQVNVIAINSARAIADLKSSAKLAPTRVNFVVTIRGTASLKSSADLERLNVLNIATARAVASLKSSADAAFIEILNIATARAVCNLISSAIGIANLIGASDTDGLTPGDAVDDLVALWGISSRCNAPEYAITRAISDLNSALQTVWNQARDKRYWTEVTITLAFEVGEHSAALPDDVQNVVGPCRTESGRPLALIATISEYETFEDLYLDGESVDTPVAYHVERSAQSGISTDPAKTRLLIVPAASEAINIKLGVVKEAPRYTKYDLVNGDVIPIPHSYSESLLMPLARYHASSFHLFRDAQAKETIDREYQKASIALGLADPIPGKANDRNKEAVA